MNLGLVSPEEKAALEAQREQEIANQRTWQMRTRKTNKLENKKQKMMCEALTRAENAKKLPEIEGELPDIA